MEPEQARVRCDGWCAGTGVCRRHCGRHALAAAARHRRNRRAARVGGHGMAAAARGAQHRPAVPARSAAASPALQPPPPGRDDVRRRCSARRARPDPVPRRGRSAPPGQRAHDERRLADGRPLSVSHSRVRRPADPLRDGGDQSRLLAADPDRSGVEGAAHGGLRRICRAGRARRLRRAAERSAGMGGPAARRRRGVARHAAHRRGVARAGGRPHAPRIWRRARRRVRVCTTFPSTARASCARRASASRCSGTTA